MIDVRLQIEEKRQPDLKQQAGGLAGVNLRPLAPAYRTACSPVPAHSP